MKYLVFSLSIFLFLSCTKQQKYTTHKQGFEYLFFTQNKNAKKPKIGDVLILDMDYYFNDDSLLFSSKELSTPFRMKLKRTIPKGATIDDALSLMNTNDSASFKVNANLFYSLTKKQDVPINVKQSDVITFYVKLKSIITFDEFQEKHKKEKQNDTPETEKKLLKHYLETTNITTKPLKSGLFFIENSAGNGNKIQTGNQITLHYSGYFVDGKLFSSSYELGKASIFTLGKDDLIPGFQEGLSLMQKGGRYTLVVPSDLAYGKEGNERIPPNKTLIFEIDVIDIK